MGLLCLVQLCGCDTVDQMFEGKMVSNMCFGCHIKFARQQIKTTDINQLSHWDKVYRSKAYCWKTKKTCEHVAGMHTCDFYSHITSTYLFSPGCAMSGNKRLGPDPAVAVADIQKQIWEVTERQGCKDLQKILGCSQHVSWKTAPSGEWLGSEAMRDLFCSLFSLHSNGVIASTKLKKALLSLQSEKGRLNFTKLHDQDWSDSMDDTIRIGAQQYRDLKRDSVKYARCTKKCSLQEKQNIDKVLDFLQLDAETKPSAPPHEDAVVASAKMQPVDGDFRLPGLVFTKVLKRTASDPASPSYVPKKQGFGSKTGASSSWEKEPSADCLLEGLGDDEAKELQHWMKQSASAEKRPAKRKCKNSLKKPAAASTKKKPATSAVKLLKKKQGVYKTTFLHRATSSSWNKAKKKALKEGRSLEEARQLGREAAEKVREDIKSGKLKEQ